SLILLGICLGIWTETAAQTEKTETLDTKKEVVKPARDFVMIQIFNDRWHNRSNQNLRLGGIGRGFSAYLCYDFPIGKKEATNFSFAAGAGVSTHNIYFNDNIPLLNSGTEELTFRRVDTVSGT